MLQTHTITGQLDIPGAIQTLGAEELAKLKQSDTTDTTKILNLRKVLSSIVADEGLSKPFLISIGDRAEKLAEAYENRQLETKQALLYFENLAREAVEAEAERQRLGLDENAFAIHKTVGIDSPEFTADESNALNALFERHSDYRWNNDQKSKLRTELYKALRPKVGTGKMIEVTNRLFNIQRV